MSQIEAVLASLMEQRFPYAERELSVPNLPGLYAVYGDERAWCELGLGQPRSDSALYVGKSEDGMVGRLRSHFGNGRTGSSTVRRSFAALLRVELKLTGIPRNRAKPSNFANYSLSLNDDSKLTQWMRDRLEIAVWVTDESRPLGDIEREVLHEWNPAVNITGVQHTWRSLVRNSRKLMSDEARDSQIAD